MSGKLFLVSTPIGNPSDISNRAISVLKSTDTLVCEERKEGMRLVNQLGIIAEVRTLNEHNESEETDALLAELKQGKSIALISDAGAPLLADPGFMLVQRCIASNISVTSIPGPNALIPALQLSGLPMDSFVFVGWLSPNKQKRRKELVSLKNETRTIVLYEAPYRLLPFLRDLTHVLGSTRRAAIAFDLTTDKETVYRGTLSKMLKTFEAAPRKGEFVVIVEGRR